MLILFFFLLNFVYSFFVSFFNWLNKIISNFPFITNIKVKIMKFSFNMF